MIVASIRTEMVYKSQAGDQVGRSRSMYFGNIEPVGEWSVRVVRSTRSKCPGTVGRQRLVPYSLPESEQPWLAE